MKIAYFGLGKMGLGPALHLARAGHQIHTAVHSDPAKVQPLLAEGGVLEGSPADAVRDADAIFTIVPDDSALEELLLAPGLLASLKPGAVLIEMTSCSAEAVQHVAQAFAARGVEVLDAPVSGGKTAADNGCMTMMCAGSQKAYEQALPLLEVVGDAKKIFLVSDKIGDGKKLKSLNNLLGAIGRIATGEVARMAQSSGLDMDKCFEVIKVSSGDSNAFRLTWPRLQSGDFNATFTVAHMRKDVDLALGLAGELNLPVCRLAGEYYHKATSFDGEDSCAVAKVEL